MNDFQPGPTTWRQPASEPEVEDGSATGEPHAGDDGGGGRAPRIRPFLDAPSLEASSLGASGLGAAGPAPYPDPPEEGGEPAARALRPFVLTGGRVAGYRDIGLHAQVTSRSVAPGTEPGLPDELGAIVALCAEPVSVAEISARLRLHLGVTRVLVGDLCEAGYLDVHVRDTAIPHDPATILRVIDGLRAFS